MSVENFIEIISATFTPGESKTWHMGGSYFELIDCPNTIDVVLTDRNGAQRGRMTAAEASFHLRNTEFDTIQLTSATAQTIRFGYGSGEAGTRRASGSVSIVNTAGAFTQGRQNVDAANAVQLLAANAARRRLLVQNNTAAQNLRVTLDGSAPSAVNGFRLVPGDLLDLDGYLCAGAIKAIFESGAAAAVEYAEG